LTHFEYVTTLLSFVVAFGVSRLLAGWVQQYLRRSQSPVDTLQVAVSFMLLIALLQNTWAMWAARDAIWTFGTFLLLVFNLLALVGASALIHPPPDHPSSNRDYYFEVRHAVFGLCAAWVILGGILDAVGLALGPPDRPDLPYGTMFSLRGVAALTFGFMAWSDRPALHWACLAVSAALQLAWILGVSNSPAA